MLNGSFSLEEFGVNFACQNQIQEHNNNFLCPQTCNPEANHKLNDPVCDHSKGCVFFAIIDPDFWVFFGFYLRFFFFWNSRDSIYFRMTIYVYMQRNTNRFSHIVFLFYNLLELPFSHWKNQSSATRTCSNETGRGDSWSLPGTAMCVDAHYDQSLGHRKSSLDRNIQMPQLVKYHSCGKWSLS